MMKVSVVIPVYNVEEYLKCCVESVLRQTYTNLEIILVDDGSTDHSGEMCDKLAEIDKRIIVIHKKNGGLSSARNAGLDFVTGEYVSYLDSDDFISDRYVEKLLNLLMKYNADIAITPLVYINEKVNEEIKQKGKEKIKIYNAEQAIAESLYQKRFSCNIPAKLFKRQIAEKVRFPEKKISEDLATCHLFLMQAKSVVFVNDNLYFYRQRINSIMHDFNEKRKDSLKHAIEIEQFCQNKYPDLKSAAMSRTFNVAVHLILDMPYEEKYQELYKIVWKELKRTRLTVVLSIRSRIRDKVAALLSYGGSNLLKKMWNSGMVVRHKER